MRLFKKKETPRPTLEHPLIQIEMPDGTVQEYPENFHITDGIHCVVCRGDFYHTHFDCENLQWEKDNTGNPIRGMFLKNAKSEHLTKCMNCDRQDYLYKHGREE